MLSRARVDALPLHRFSTRRRVGRTAAFTQVVQRHRYERSNKRSSVQLSTSLTSLGIHLGFTTSLMRLIGNLGDFTSRRSTDSC